MIDNDIKLFMEYYEKTCNYRSKWWSTSYVTHGIRLGAHYPSWLRDYVYLGTRCDELRCRPVGGVRGPNAGLNTGGMRDICNRALYYQYYAPKVYIWIIAEHWSDLLYWTGTRYCDWLNMYEGTYGVTVNASYHVAGMVKFNPDDGYQYRTGFFGKIIRRSETLQRGTRINVISKQ